MRGMHKMKIYEINEFFDLSHTIAAPLFEGKRFAWQVLPEIKEFILKIGKTLPKSEYDNPAEGIWIAKSAKVAPTASIAAPCIIGPNTEVRQCAYLRGSVLVGEGAVVGNSTELKNCILFDSVHVPHYNYIGDSVLGYNAHFGAGAVTSNIKSDKTNVTIRVGNVKLVTGLRKLGAIIGDYTEVGCGAILNPGTVIGRETTVYPQSVTRGFIPAKSIYKGPGKITEKKERS